MPERLARWGSYNTAVLTLNIGALGVALVATATARTIGSHLRDAGLAEQVAQPDVNGRLRSRCDCSRRR